MSGTTTGPEGVGRTAVVLCSQNLPVPQDRRVWREAATLAAAGYRVTAVCPRGSGQPRREHLQGVDVVRFPAPPALPGLVGQLVETGWSLVCIAVLACWLRGRGRLDVLHAANPPDSFFLVGWLLRPVGVRFVYDQHDLCPELLSARAPGAPRWLRWVLARLELASYRRADLVVAPNNSYRSVALARGALDPDQVVVVRSGPDQCRPRASTATRSPLVIAFAGVMNEQDNVELLVTATAEVLARRPGAVVLDLIGSGDDVPRLRGLVEERGIESQVRWAGWLTGDELVERLAAASIGVSLDRDDDFSRLSTMAKVPDYLGVGLPVLLADLPENRVTAGGAGRYFRPADVGSLVAEIEALLDDRAALAALEEEAARRGPQLLWRHGGDRLTSAYEWLLRGAPAVPGDQHVAAVG